MNTSLGALQVFISTGCRGCKRALELVAWARKRKPGLRIDVIDLAKEPWAGDGKIFAVPTYLYDGNRIYVGNPDFKELQTWLDKLSPEV